MDTKSKLEILHAEAEAKGNNKLAALFADALRELERRKDISNALTAPAAAQRTTHDPK